MTVIDWYSRYIVDCELSCTLDKSFVLACLQRALTFRKPEIIDSDQGGHFTNLEYILLFEGAGVKVSMDGQGQCWTTLTGPHLRQPGLVKSYFGRRPLLRSEHPGFGSRRECPGT